MSLQVTASWVTRVEALLALALAKTASAVSGSSTKWIDVAPGTTLAPTAAQQCLSCDTSGAPIVLNLVAAPTDGQEQVIRCTGAMFSPVVVNAQGAGIKVELLTDLGTFGASTWLALQGQSLVLKYDGAPTVKAWKVKGLSSVGTRGLPSFNPGWFAASAIQVDEQNTSGTARDSNDGRTAATALLTWGEAVRRWGSVNPALSISSLLITFLSECTSEVRFTPWISNGVFPEMTAVDGPITPAVLAGVTPKGRTAGANSPLIATLPAGTAVGDQVRNTTAGKLSRCSVAKALGLNSFELTQPLVHVVGEVMFPLPAEVDTWANLDTVQIVRQVRVNFAEVEGVLFGFDANFANALTLSNMTLADPEGIGNSNLELGPGVNVVESTVERFRVGSGTVGLTDLNVNVLWQGGGDVLGNEAQFIGGGFVNLGWNFLGSNMVFDADFVFEAITSFVNGQTIFGFAFIGGGSGNTALFATNAQLRFQTGAYGGHVIYGRAAITVNLTGTTHATMVSGTWAAGWTAPTLVTGVTMNGGTVAQTHTNATPDVVTSGVTTSVANADAATNGVMMVWGGASLSKAA